MFLEHTVVYRVCYKYRDPSKLRHLHMIQRKMCKIIKCMINCILLWWSFNLFINRFRLINNKKKNQNNIKLWYFCYFWCTGHGFYYHKQYASEFFFIILLLVYWSDTITHNNLIKKKFILKKYTVVVPRTHIYNNKKKNYEQLDSDYYIASLIKCYSSWITT